MTASPAMLGFSPRYAAYAAFHGLAPEDMVRRDREDFPGGCMAGFIAWTQARWSDWRAETGYQGPVGAEQEARFDRWLEKRVRAAHAEGI